MPAADLINEDPLNDTGWFTKGNFIFRHYILFTISNNWITEIQNMMYGFGDSKQPLRETAELVENIVKEQLKQFLNLLSEVATKIDSKKVGVREFLILLRFGFCNFRHKQVETIHFLLNA